LSETLQKRGLFSAFYTDRGSHYFLTPKAGEKVDKDRLTQVGRALKDLKIEHIPSYNLQARGRTERVWDTLQKRLPPLLRRERIKTIEAANRWLSEVYLAQHNARFTVSAAEGGTAFVSFVGDLENILCSRPLATALWGARFAGVWLPSCYTTWGDTTAISSTSAVSASAPTCALKP